MSLPGPIDRRSFLATGGLALGTAVLPDIKRLRRVPRSSTGGLSGAIRGPVLTPGTPGFAAAAHLYNERFDGVLPAAVARPIDALDVQRAVRWAVRGGVPIRARSGGHSYAGYSTLHGGVMLDLRKLNQVSVDRGAGTATIGAGAQLIDVYSQLAAHGATLPGGSCPSVGIAGVTLGGGMGLAARAFGLTADNLRSIRIVTADGQLRTVSRSSDPDLFWALRGGGGGNFGVVTDFSFAVHRLPAAASYFFLTWPWEEAAAALQSWLRWAPHTDDRCTSIFHLQVAGRGPSVLVTGQYLGPSSQVSGLVAPLRAAAGMSLSVGSEPYLALQMRWAGCTAIGEAACHTVGSAPGGTLARASFSAKSDYLDRVLSDAGASALTEAVAERSGVAGSGAVLLDSYGGAIDRLAPSETAFVHRGMLAAMQYLSYEGGGPWLEQTWRRMRPYVSGQAYQNYIDAALPGWQQAYYGRNLARLEQVRKAVDPDHFFNFPQAIGR